MARPTKYKPEYAEQAKKLCKNNAFTDAELAVFFGVNLSTLHLWKIKQPEFSNAIKIGKAPANARVEKSLYDRAMGYSAVETDIRVVNGKIVKTEVVKHYPPDPTSLIFYLKNRMPSEFREKRDTATDLDAQIKAVELERAKFLLAKLIAGETDTETEDDQAEFFLELSKRLPD